MTMTLLQIFEQREGHDWQDLTQFLADSTSALACDKRFHHKPDASCLRVYQESDAYRADTAYFVGVDWLLERELAVYVAPKVNQAQRQIDYLGMLLNSLEAPENLEHLDDLFHIEYDRPWIEIEQQQDMLSPLLLVQFLKLVQRIVRSGLKKAYYRITANLNGRIKGRILVGQQLRQNASRSRHTHTVCNYQEHGINTPENQFLKRVLSFAAAYLERRDQFFTPEQLVQLRQLLGFCQPAFEHVTLPEGGSVPVVATKNAFYRDYEEAIRIGDLILKRFSYNINRISSDQVITPPFWVDMSKLFELYVFNKIRKALQHPDAVSYHDRYRGGKETDLLINAPGYQCVIDCKYKHYYRDQSPSLKDLRQLAGYVRLKSVYRKLKIPVSADATPIIRGVIIYPNRDTPEQPNADSLFATEINDYVSFFKMGIRLPEVPVKTSVNTAYNVQAVTLT